MDTDGLALRERIAKSMWRAMGWACDEKSNAVINSLKKSLQMEKHEMVARLAHRKRWNVITKIMQDGSTSGSGTLVGMCGIESQRNGKAKKILMRARKKKLCPPYTEEEQMVWK